MDAISETKRMHADGFVVHTRTAGLEPSSPYEKAMVLPAPNQLSASMHAWADARFAVDIMAEHALFFVLLMPPEVAGKERSEAKVFHERLTSLLSTIEKRGPPAGNEVASFCRSVVEEIKPFIEFKARMADGQASGTLRSLVWPLFFDHTRHEAERWVRRLEQLATGESEFERGEVSHFWTEIMDEHARFVAHLLDPSEFELIDTCMKTSRVFCHLHEGGVHGVTAVCSMSPAL